MTKGCKEYLHYPEQTSSTVSCSLLKKAYPILTFFATSKIGGGCKTTASNHGRIRLLVNQLIVEQRFPAWSVPTLCHDLSHKARPGIDLQLARRSIAFALEADAVTYPNDLSKYHFAAVFVCGQACDGGR